MHNKAAVAGLFLFTIAVGWLIAVGYWQISLGAACLLVLVLIRNKPWLPFLLVLVVVASIAQSRAFPQLALGPFDVFLSEIVLGVSLVAGFALREKLGVHASSKDAISLALKLFIIFTGLGIFIGLSNGAGIMPALVDVRVIAFYSVYWLALIALVDADTRNLVFKLAAVVVAVVVALQLAQVLIGIDHLLFYVAPDSNLVAIDSTTGFLRVRPPGLTLVYIACAFAISYLLWGPKKYRTQVVALAAISGLGVLLSLNRNMVIGLIVGLLGAGLAVKKRDRLIGAFVIGMVSLLMAALIFGASLASVSVIGRVLSLGDVAGLESGTLVDRYYENGLALNALMKNPLTGIGWGSDYGAISATQQGSIPRLSVHNQYIWLWLRTGLPGLLAMLSVFFACIMYGISWCRKRAWDQNSWLGAAVIASVIAMALSASVGHYLSNPDAIVPVMAVLALASVLHNKMGKVDNSVPQPANTRNAPT